MKTSFCLVRHGPTHAKTVVGWTDLPADLSDTDRISRVAGFIPEQAVVISSDLSRAVSTANAIVGDRTRLAHDARLREFNFGAWEGMSFDEISDRDAELSRDFWERPGETRAPGGESFYSLQTRVMEALGQLEATHRGTQICCVAHFGVILAAVAKAADLAPASALRFQIDPLSVTSLDYWPETDSWRVNAVNHNP